jgi:hypothetical protein
VPGYFAEVHHVTPWAKTHTTDINDLALACGGHHPLAEQAWTTRQNHHGNTEWIPPPHLDYGQPRTNTAHHPEKLLCDDEDDDAGGIHSVSPWWFVRVVQPCSASGWWPPQARARSLMSVVWVLAHAVTWWTSVR